jgi:hypothetical protein
VRHSTRPRSPLSAVAAAALVAAGPAGCKPAPPPTPAEEVRVDGRPVAEWITMATNADDTRGQRAAWMALRRAGPPAVPAIRRAMERTTDPEKRARVGLTFSFLCPSALPAMAEEARTAQGDVQTQLEMSSQVIAGHADGAGGVLEGCSR